MSITTIFKIIMKLVERVLVLIEMVERYRLVSMLEFIAKFKLIGYDMVYLIADTYP